MAWARYLRWDDMVKLIGPRAALRLSRKYKGRVIPPATAFLQERKNMAIIRCVVEKKEPIPVVAWKYKLRPETVREKVRAYLKRKIDDEIRGEPETPAGPEVHKVDV